MGLLQRTAEQIHVVLDGTTASPEIQTMQVPRIDQGEENLYCCISKYRYIVTN